MADRLQAAVRALPPGWVLDPAVPEVLIRLRRLGLRLLVVSNWDGDLAERLTELGLAQHFDHIADSTVVGVRKPDPRILAEACDRVGVAVGECLHVGDRPETDVAAARAAGARPLLYDPIDAWAGGSVARVRRLLDVLAYVMPTAARAVDQ